MGRRKNRKQKVSKKQIVAAMGSLKPMKRHPADAQNSQVQTNTAPWLIIHPYHIQGAPTVGATNTNENRLSDQVWVNRCSGYFNVQIGAFTTNEVEFRKLCGWYKGSQDSSDHAINAFNAVVLTNHIPNRLTRYDPDNYKIVEDKSWTSMPKFVYNGASEPGEDNVPVAVWQSQMIKCNFRFNRTVRFSDDTENDDSNPVLGAQAVGWHPFMALQIRCPSQDFTGTTGNNPSPKVDSKFTTYFKDAI